jgi:CheY-like chemotaxis protein
MPRPRRGILQEDEQLVTPYQGRQKKRDLKIPELARLLGITPQAVHLWLVKGTIRNIRRTSTSGNYLIPWQEAIRLLKLSGREVPGLWTRFRRRILVIDDCQAIRRLVRDAFRNPKVRLEVMTAASAEDGLVSAATFMPHVIVIDDVFESDRLQGAHAIAVIRKVAAFKRIKVIAMTASPSASEKMLDAGANLVLRKPFGLEELRKSIYRQAFGKRKISYSGKPLQGLIDVSECRN